MKITPGYDFTTTEVPTKAHLQQMISGGEVYGIDISQINSTLIGIKTADSSVSLPAEGWMWTDVAGCVWVRSRFGPVKLWRGGWGGMETRRYPQGAQVINPPINNDRFLYQCAGGTLSYKGTTPTGATLESNVFFTASQANGERFKNLETGVSGGYTRSLLYGGGWFPAQVLTFTQPAYIRAAANNAYDVSTSIPYSDPAVPVLGIRYGSMSDSAYSGVFMMWGWQFGTFIARLG
jgi:hypothetical protein